MSCQAQLLDVPASLVATILLIKKWDRLIGWYLDTSPLDECVQTDNDKQVCIAVEEVAVVLPGGISI